MDFLGASALVAALTSLVLGLLGWVQQRRIARAADATERKSAAFLELEHALTEQRALIDLYRQDSGRQQAQITMAEAKATEALRAHADCEAITSALERRLHIAEARITELGG